MPFDKGTEFLKSYLDTRRTALTRNKVLTWSTDAQTTLKAMIDTQFDGTIENDAWEQLTQKSDGNTDNKMIGTRNKIGWLAACRRDLRTQFSAASDCRQRVALDHMRFHILRLNWAWKGVKRFIDIVNQRLA